MGWKTSVFHLHAMIFLFSLSFTSFIYVSPFIRLVLIKLFVWGYNDDGSNKSNSVAYSDCLVKWFVIHRIHLKLSSFSIHVICIILSCSLFLLHDTIATKTKTTTTTARTTKIHSMKRNDTMVLFLISCQNIFRGVFSFRLRLIYLLHVVSFTMQVTQKIFYLRKINFEQISRKKRNSIV